MKKLVQMLCGLGLVLATQANAPAQPVITNQPQGITVNNGSAATFAVGASNATNYQWQFNTTNLSDGTLPDGVMISGSATPTLTLENVTTNEAGSYTVVVSGAGPSVTSFSPAILTIVPGTIVRFTFSGLLTNAPGSNVQVQLFNHDKPVTVQNFLQYITAGAYTNMFFDRCIPNFVLQGGDYGATDQTNTSSPMTGWDIYSMFTTAETQPNPAFQTEINNEFSVGPLIHNRFGTIAMALHPYNPNSASSAFFFNLEDNSANLDFQNGGFTVFGRILGGADVLQYFNTLANESGIATNGVFVDEVLNVTNLTVTNLPVNYVGSQPPVNANLVFCALRLTSPSGDTNWPTISITFPTTNDLLSNSVPLTVEGTAIDTNNIGLAWVRCDLIPLAADDGTLPNGGVSLTNYVLGATNWSLDFGIIAPGVYKLGAQTQDEAGNLSSEVFIQRLTNTVIFVNGNGTLTFTNGVFTNLNAVGYPFQQNSNYDLMETPGPNELFATWNNAYATNNMTEQTYSLNYGLFTATFISNGIPNSVAVTYPPANAVLTNGTFNITGTISAPALPPVTVACTIFSQTSGFSVSAPITTIGTTNWSVAVSNLPPEFYALEVIGVDTNGNSTMISENFNFGVSLQLDVVGPGTISGPTNGQAIPIGTNFTVTANPNPGQLFFTWSNSVTGLVSLNTVQTNMMSAGLTLTATFISNTIPNSIAFTSPPANGIIGLSPFYIAGTISNVPSTPVTVTCQIFSNSIEMFFNQPLVETNDTTTWSMGRVVLGVGSYTLVATAVDSAGNSTLISEKFTVQYSDALQLIIVGKGNVSPVTNGEILPLGTNFVVTATPAAGQVFYSWSNGTQISNNSTQTYTMAGGMTLTATFIPSNTAKGISFTYPAAHARLNTNTFPLKGRIAPGFKPATITCQVFQTNGLAVGPPLTTSGTSTWETTVTNLPGGYYTVEGVATNAAGMSTVVSQNFSVMPFAAAVGTYSGLFICTNTPVAPTNSGFLTFTLASSGAFSGKLVVPAYPAVPIYSLSFSNLDFTTAFVSFGIGNFHGSPLYGVVYLDLNIGTGIASGTISSTAWTSPLICYRAAAELSSNTTASPGKYIFSLRPVSQTNGVGTNGYAALVVAKGGTMALSGALPDNTTFSQSARVSKDGIWPLYAIPAGDRNNGMLLGWETFSNLSCGGQLHWYKAPGIGAYYTGGVGVSSNMLLTSMGTNYIPPAEGNYSIIFQAGTNSVLASNDLSVTRSNGQFVVPKPAPADKLAISLSANGVINGHFVPDSGGNPLQFKGAFFGQSQTNSGFILDGDGQTGYFLLEPQ